MAYGFAPKYESTKTAKSPNFLEYIPGNLQQRLSMLRASVVDRDLDRTDLSLDFSHRFYELILDSSIHLHTNSGPAQSYNFCLKAL